MFGSILVRVVIALISAFAISDVYQVPLGLTILGTALGMIIGMDLGVELQKWVERAE